MFSVELDAAGNAAVDAQHKSRRLSARVFAAFAMISSVLRERPGGSRDKCIVVLIEFELKVTLGALPWQSR